MNGKQRDRPGAPMRPGRRWMSWGADALLLAGAAAITAGAGLIFFPAGLIAGGALCIGCGILLALGNGGGDGG